MSNKILFLYNNVNDVKGVSEAMKCAFDYTRGKNPIEVSHEIDGANRIVFGDGDILDIIPISNGFSLVDEYDKLFIDESVTTFIEPNRFGKIKFETYNKDTFE